MRTLSFEGSPVIENSGLRGFDWVVWDDVDGQITATYVFPRKFGTTTGIEEGDVLFLFNYQQYFRAEILNGVIQNLKPGDNANYTLLRNGEEQEVTVQIKPYPTLMYPLGDLIWGASMWGFVLALFLHLIALIIATPLAFKSRGGWYSSAMIIASGLWIFCNVLRIGIVNFAPPEFLLDKITASIFNGLTIIGLGGWLLFPALLAKLVLHDQPYKSWISRTGNLLLFGPGTILFLLVLTTEVLGTVGPISIDHLIPPILFYICWYTAGAITAYLLFKFNTEETAWNKGWSIFVIVTSGIAAYVALGGPFTDRLSAVQTGWVIVFVQLLGVGPITLISFATLRYGKPGAVLTKVITRMTGFGAIFFLFVACLFLWRRWIGFELVTSTIFSAFLAMGMVPVYNRIVMTVQDYVQQYLFTERQKGRQKLSRFSQTVIDIPTKQELVDRTIIEIGDSLGVSSGVMYLKDDSSDTGWLKSNFRPSYPYITEDIVSDVWPHFDESPDLWARNNELNEHELNDTIKSILEESKVDLVVPVRDQNQLTGLLILGQRNEKGTVFNMEDVDLLRTVSNQVALAVDRQRLFQREKELARQTSQAELAALRAQINPHFLFNTLNAISSLIEEKPSEAVTTVDNLSSIFRYTLRTGKQAFASLDDEISLVKKYLAIEKIRFGDRLEIDWQIDPDVSNVQIPALTLQTIVENSIVHGISKMREDGKLTIVTKANDAFSLEMVVSDNGPGIREISGRGEVSGKQSFHGVGTTNVYTRLRELYGRNDLLRFRSEPGEGSIVRILIPRVRLDQNQTS